MDTRKLQFLQAVVGIDGAKALVKAAERAEELDQAIFPRTILAWLEITAPLGHEGTVPGIDTVSFHFKKTEQGFDGSIAVEGEIHRFQAASINHLAGCVAVALGLDHERVSPLAKSEQIAKLGKSIDLLVKSHLVKTSWNVKQQRNNVTPEQAEKRFGQFAQSIGLNATPVNNRNANSFERKQEGNKIPYVSGSSFFNVDHEMGHAAMTAPGQSLESHQTAIDKMNGIPADNDDKAADYIAHRLARRAGLNKIPGSQGLWNPEDKYDRKQLRPIVNQHVGVIDSGAKFSPTGVLQSPVGVDAKINARAKQLGKTAIKPTKSIKLPGTTAKPIAPQGPMAPTPIQPKNQKQMPQGAAGTAQTSPLPQLPKVSKKPSIQVTKSESQKKCAHCGRGQFQKDEFKGCFCWTALAKSVKVIPNDEGYKLEFGAVWDQDAISTLVETFRGK